MSTPAAAARSTTRERTRWPGSAPLAARRVAPAPTARAVGLAAGAVDGAGEEVGAGCAAAMAAAAPSAVSASSAPCPRPAAPGPPGGGVAPCSSAWVTSGTVSHG
jgi:hypothetical protein